MTKEEFAKHLEYLRRRLHGHSKAIFDSETLYVKMDYVNARIDDLISTYGETKNTTEQS